ncbi:MAG: cobalamin-binding protein [Myxococcota bacterium]
MTIVSLLPSATEIACALGLRDQLAAVSHECDYPSGVEGLPHITDSIIPHGLSQAEIDAAVSKAFREGRALYTVNGAMLEQIQPDIILTQDVCDVCAVNQDTVLSAMTGLPQHVAETARLVSFTGKSIGGVFHDIETLADAAGIIDQGAALLDGLRQRLQILEQAEHRNTPSVMMLEWPDPPFSGGHWVPEQIALAGGRSAIGGPGQDSRRLTWDEILDADPDIICSIACGYDLEHNTAFARALFEHPQASRLRAVQQGQVWAFDANSFFSRPAPRLVDGAELLRVAIQDGKSVELQSRKIHP